MQTIEIAERFCGPPRMGNGGYVAGMLAKALTSDSAEVTIRAAVPLSKPLSLDLHDGTVRLLDADVLIAEASIATEFGETPPFKPSYEEALAARPRFVGFRQHGFPRCFVCGTEREDGLRIFPGSVEPGDRVIAPWEPDESLVAEGSDIKTEFLWAALDCAGAFAFTAEEGRGRPMLLGRLTGRVTGAIRARERCVVAGWQISREGRKSVAGTAVWNEAGDLRAVARAVWFGVPEEGT